MQAAPVTQVDAQAFKRLSCHAFCSGQSRIRALRLQGMQGFSQTLMIMWDNGMPCSEGPQQATASQAVVPHQLWLARPWQQQAVMDSDRPGQETQHPALICIWTATMLHETHSSLGTAGEDLMHAGAPT